MLSGFDALLLMPILRPAFSRIDWVQNALGPAKGQW